MPCTNAPIASDPHVWRWKIRPANLTPFIVIILAGCVSLTDQAERVRVVRNPNAVQGCTSLGAQMDSVSGWGGFAGAGLEDNERSLRNETGRRGGDTLLLLQEVATFPFPQTYGQAYRCQQMPVTAPAPIQPPVQPTITNGQRMKIEAECRRLWPDNREQFEICMRQ
jgi:Domain of unknown function (DUF4156)